MVVAVALCGHEIHVFKNLFFFKVLYRVNLIKCQAWGEGDRKERRGWDRRGGEGKEEEEEGQTDN